MEDKKVKEKEIEKVETPVKAVPKFPMKKKVGCALLNVRECPDGKVLRVIKEGDAVKVIGEDKAWYMLEDGSYVMKEFLK